MSVSRQSSQMRTINKAPSYQSTYMARMNERQERTNKIPRQRPSTNNGNSHYESSYMKKLNENPAPSITMSSSFGSKRGILPATKAPSPQVHSSADKNRIPRVKSYQHQPLSPTINTEVSEAEVVSSPHTVGQPLSPAETINAILCEETNYQPSSPIRSSPRSLRNLSPPGRRKNYNPRGPSPERPRATINSINRYGNSTDLYENRSPSPRSRRSVYSSSMSPERQPLSTSYKTNIPGGGLAETASVRKLPHETRYESPSGSRRFRTAASYAAPFWTQVSVKVSATLLKAGKDKKYAEAAQIAVVQAGEEQYDTDQAALNFVASKASLAIIEAGGDPNTAAIATVACLQANDKTPSNEAHFKKEIERVMSEMKDKASAVAQTTYDGGTKAVNAISELAFKGYEDLKNFSEQSFRRYRVYQRNYLIQRQQALKRIQSRRRRGYDRRYNDSRDDDTYDEEDRYKRRSSPRPRGSARYESDDSYENERHRRSHRSGRRSKSSTFDSRSSSSSVSSASYSSRTGSSVSTFESSDDKRSGSRRRSSKKSGKRRGGRFKSKSKSSSSSSSSRR